MKLLPIAGKREKHRTHVRLYTSVFESSPDTVAPGGKDVQTTLETRYNVPKFWVNHPTSQLP